MMTYLDLKQGKGKNYILLSKEEDCYKIVYAEDRLLDIQKKLNNLFEEVRNDINRKQSNKTLVS